MTERLRIRLLHVISGSRSYGTFRPDSDYDYRSVHTLGLDDLLDPFFREEQIESNDGEEDCVDFELKKFLYLAAQSNPNILELLFVPESCILEMNESFRKHIWSNREAFLSKEALKRFIGYCSGQMARIKNHRAWFMNPPKGYPDRVDFSIPEYITNEQLNQVVNMDGRLFSEEHGRKLALWRDFLSAKKRWQTYQVWLKQRNPERAELEKSYRYDTKHGAHLLRLGMECEDIFTEKTIHIPSKNVHTILDVKNGKWTIERLTEWADAQFEKLKVLANNSDLPAHPDRNLIAKLYRNVINEVCF
jgi:predicted nucleotidyltransferase